MYRVGRVLLLYTLLRYSRFFLGQMMQSHLVPLMQGQLYRLLL